MNLKWTVLILPIFFATNSAVAAPRAERMRQPASVTTTSQSRPSLITSAPTDRKLYFSSNVFDLAKGAGNVGIDVFSNNKLSFSFRIETSSEKDYFNESRKKSGNKLTIDRTAYGMGVSYWVGGNEAKQGLVLNPFIAFGTKKDPLDVDNTNGIGLRATGFVKLTRDLTAEGGIMGNNLDDGNMKGDFYGGIGYMF